MRHGRLRVITLAGLTPYAKAHALQLKMVEERKRGTIGDTLLLLEHPPVITLGRNADPAGVTAAPSVLEELGIETHRIERGGQVTYHGPGQVVGYPVLHLRRMGLGTKRYVTKLEGFLIRALRELGIEAERDPHYPGVWVNQAKIAALGVRISEKVTTHGFALNLDPRLEDFSHIVPCGIPDREVTSIKTVAGQVFPREEVIQVLVRSFAEEFGVQMMQTGEQKIRRITGEGVTQ